VIGAVFRRSELSHCSEILSLRLNCGSVQDDARGVTLYFRQCSAWPTPRCSWRCRPFSCALFSENLIVSLGRPFLLLVPNTKPTSDVGSVGATPTGYALGLRPKGIALGCPHRATPRATPSAASYPPLQTTQGRGTQVCKRETKSQSQRLGDPSGVTRLRFANAQRRRGGRRRPSLHKIARHRKVGIFRHLHARVPHD